MNEIKHVHLGRQSFTIAVNAHTELRHYLDAIAVQIGEHGSDVIEEVELRMAELLTEKGFTAEKVILPKDIKYLKDQLGEPSDFSEQGSDSTAQNGEESTSKRLFRDTQRAMIAGVAAGLARYFAIDPIIVRILFVVLTFVGGSGVLIYILLWLLVPEAKTTSERLSMQGKAATVDNLKQVVGRADLPGAAYRAGGTLAKLIRICGRSVLFIIGLPLAVVSGLALLWTLAVAGYYVMDGAKVAGQVVAPIGGHEVTGFIAGVIALVTLLLGLLLIGIAMMRRRWQVPAWGVATLVGVFIITTSISGVLAADVVPEVRQRVEAMHHQQTLQLPAFSRAELTSSDTRFSFVPDSHTYLVYHYFGQFDTTKLHTDITDGTLHVNGSGTNDNTDCNLFCVHSGPDLEVVLHAPSLTSVTVTGDQANFVVRHPLNQTSLELNVAGNAYADLSYVNPSKITLRADGSGTRNLQITLKSQAGENDGLNMNDDGIVSIVHTDELDFTTVRNCDEGDPYVFLYNSPAVLRINGKVTQTDREPYRSIRTPDVNNVYNCLSIR